MINATLKSMWNRKRRLLGASTAVVFGIAFLVATLVLGDSMRSGFDTFFTEAYAGTDLEVRATTEIGSDELVQRGTVDEILVGRLADAPHVEHVAANVDGTVQIVGANGDPVGGDGPPTFGGNWIEGPVGGGTGFNGFSIVEGRAPASVEFGEPVEVVINRKAALDGGLHVGDLTTVLTPDPIAVAVVGISRFGDDDSIAGSTFTAFTLVDAQRILLDSTDQISSVLISATRGVSPDQLRIAVQPFLPSDTTALTQTELIAEQNQAISDDFLAFIEAFLLAFAVVALLVAAFSIHNTFSILVAQRTRESALLRALGASRRNILTSVTVESFLLGSVASLVGIGAGLGLAAALKAVMDAAGFGLPAAIGLRVESDTAIVAVVVGLAVTLFATITPAVRASRVAPLEALRDVAIDSSGRPRIRFIVGGTAAAAGVGIALSATLAGDAALASAGFGSLIALIGVVMLGPVVATVATSVLGAPVAATRGHAGTLARRNAMRSPRRTAGTASALMIGTAVVALFATFGSSVKASLDELIDESFANDLVIATDGFSGSPLSPDLVVALAALDEVAVAAALSDAPILLDGNEHLALAADPRALASVADLDETHGSLVAVGADGFAASTEFADEHGWELGSTVPVAFADGASTTLTLRSIFANANVIGDLVLPSSAWTPHQGRSGVAVILINLANGVDVSAGKRAVEAVADRFGSPDVQDRQEYLDANSAEIDQMLGLIYGLLGLAILIAVLGIANTLSLSIHERTRELGLLRAVGQTRSQLRSTIRWESVIISIFGTIGGLSLGTFFGWAVIRAMKVQTGFGSFELPVTTLLVVLGLALAAGIVAAVRPARRAARLDILAAIATT